MEGMRNRGGWCLDWEGKLYTSHRTFIFFLLIFCLTAIQEFAKININQRQEA